MKSSNSSTWKQTIFIRWSFRVFAVLLGGAHTWAAVSSYSMNPDGIAYLDMGEAYLRGDWSSAVNAYWSPFYSWILGLALRILKPGIQFEFPVVHLVNFTIYLAALVSFEFFWSQLIGARLVQKTGEQSTTFPVWLWWALGYALFIYTSLNLIEIWAVTPDMCVAAFVYLAAGFAVKIRIGEHLPLNFALLGIALGFGYLAKAPILPLALIFIFASLFTIKGTAQVIRLGTTALAGFLLIGGPFILALSSAKGYLTFGESGKLNYARLVNGLPDVHWQGEIAGSGSPVHPTRKILEHPAIYEFAGPIQGTYPPWYDPSHWFEGVKLRFHWQEQIKILLSNSLYYLDLFLKEQAGLAAGVAFLFLMSQTLSWNLKAEIRRANLLIPALAAFLMYALVYVENRYLAPFIVLFWADLLTGIHLPDFPQSRRLIVGTGVVMLIFVMANIGIHNLAGVRDLTMRSPANRSNVEANRPPSWPGEVAGDLRRFGVGPGDPVAIIGYGFNSFWARLAKVQIIAEMPSEEADLFWFGQPAVREDAIRAFASTNAKAIVAENVPVHSPIEGWHQIGNSNYYLYSLER